MDEKDFIERCNMGMDIEFDYDGKSYGVLAWCDDGIHIYEKNNLDDEMVLPDADAALDRFIINGMPLRTVLPNVAHML